LLAAVERRMPVLEGPELEVVRDEVAAGRFKNARARLDDLIAAVEKRSFERPIVIGAGTAPHVGQDFTIADLGLDGAWLDAADGEPGFWTTVAPVDAALWRNVVKYARFDVYDSEQGGATLSWSNARVFCGELTKHERDANRLPADHVYTLPTLSQLERMRRSGDAPAPGVWLWTDDGFGPDPDAPSNPMPFAWQNGDPPQREPRASSRPCPGTVFRVVLTRVR
ncbi:MAG: hypothetical protein KDC98_03895, partial [Planctomycetes bacterium]|nr:hypothetical protein [Planctomycetota bacterium]